MAKTETRTVAPALKTLVEGLVDYAGLFPPASKSLDEALRNYRNYQSDPNAWMLNCFVVPAKDLDSVSGEFDGHLSVLTDSDCSRAAAIESKAVVKTEKPVYCEVSPESLDSLRKVKASSNYAKIRCGGVVPEAIPSVKHVAGFILACAELDLPFKATAGLHHPIRSEQRLTYEEDAPKAVLHGFINVLMASALAYHGTRQDEIIEAVLSESDPGAFRFDERAHYKDLSLDLNQIKEARKSFIHSIGSCSFTEPIEDLEKLALI